MAQATAARASRRDWVGLAVLMLPCLLVSMDLTVLNLAVPHLSADLKPSSAQLLWIVDIYGFLIAGCLITMGTLGDRIGRRRLLLIGAAAFGAASVLAAFSTSADMLIVTRAVLGIAGATLMPSTLSLIRNMFHDPAQRTLAIGIWTTSFSVGGALGPLIGGILLEHFWWGSVLLVAVPPMVLLLALGPWLLPEFSDPSHHRYDIASAPLSLAAVLAVVYGIKRIAEDGPDWIAALSIAVGASIGILFVRRQARLPEPLIDLRLFRVPAFSAALGTNMAGFLAMFGISFLLAQYLQLVIGLTPLQAGLWSVPSSVGYTLGSMLTPWLAHRFSAATVVSGGLLVAAVGFGALAGLGHSPGLALVVAGSVVFAVGLAPVYILTTDMIVATAPAERAGAASAISETGTELGGALGIALLGSIATAAYRGAMSQAGGISGIPAEVMETARATLGGALAAASRLPLPAGTDLLAMARDAFTQALQAASLISAALMIATAVVAVLALRPSPSAAPGQGL
ncbi:MAG TPA: MFS transporter [Vineibacter terrae]|nr:MFS transporter [Vineibacter terrae]HEX2885994.1 MFS transporter [Vineibacter terrae]